MENIPVVLFLPLEFLGETAEPMNLRILSEKWVTVCWARSSSNDFLIFGHFMGTCSPLVTWYEYIRVENDMLYCIEILNLFSIILLWISRCLWYYWYVEQSWKFEFVEIFIMKKIFLIIYGTALFMLTMAFLLTSNYKDYRFYITLIILLAIGKIVEGRINK